MRVIWLVLAACSGAAGPAPATPANQPEPQVAPTTVAFAATHISARVGNERDAWTDIIIDGIDEDARFRCHQLVKREREQEGKRVLRDCAGDPLPTPPRSVFQLVIVQPLSLEDVLMPDLTPREPLFTSDKPIGTLQRVAAFADRKGCEEMLVELAAAEQRQVIADQQSYAKFLDDQVRRVNEELEPVCKAARETAERCAKLTDTKRELCELDRERHQRLCDFHTSQRDDLDARRKQAPSRRRIQRSCRPG